MIYTPREYQKFTTARIVDSPAAGALVDMGLGKTVATLTAIDELMHDRLEISKVLVIAPKKVVESVWQQEAQKWDHLRHLRIVQVTGTEKQRKKALDTQADIYLIGCDNTVWLIGLYAGKRWPFDMLVIDESSKFKNHDAKRFKALKRIVPAIPRKVILTGTPMPQSYLDLWSQMFILDQGERLGKNITEYRNKFFTKNPFDPYAKWELLKNTDPDAAVTGEDYYGRKILDLISDVCFSLKTEDYLQLPERIDSVQWVDMLPSVMKQYREFEREQILQLGDAELTAFNAGALSMKLTQFANGAVYYGENREYTLVHDEKIDAITETVDSLNGAPVLIFYQFQHDLERLMHALKSYGPRILRTDADVQAWNRRELPVLIAHPASAGHGLNLQHGGNRIEWFGVPRSSEQYQQGYKRIHRSGVDQVVVNNRILTRGTVDEAALKSLDGKISLQDAMLEFVKVKRDEYSRVFAVTR